ncbi:SRPBCC family protein [Limnoglobus roseus]|uniref:hypothetical protein n=1 Tax=Limnoglobus roseus TaxID=2598579 RepID=UPI00143D34CD|nr:hypothetical protein [Limnoglobus roseus]
MDDRTEVRVAVKYDPPAVTAWFDGSLDSQIRGKLERFQQILEASDRVRAK